MLFVCSVLRMLFPWLKLARHPGLKTCVYTRDQMNPCAALAVEKAFCSKAGSCKATEGVGALNSAVPKVRTRAEGAWLRRTGLCLGLSWLEAAPCSPLCLCVCSSLLREHSIDGTGWAPTRTLKDVVWGLNSLFTDLLNFDDPLNIEAAEHHLRDKEDFRSKVEDYMKRYAR